MTSAQRKPVSSGGRTTTVWSFTVAALFLGIAFLAWFALFEWLKILSQWQGLASSCLFASFSGAAFAWWAIGRLSSKEGQAARRTATDTAKCRTNTEATAPKSPWDSLFIFSNRAETINAKIYAIRQSALQAAGDMVLDTVEQQVAKEKAAIYNEMKASDRIALAVTEIAQGAVNAEKAGQPRAQSGETGGGASPAQLAADQAARAIAKRVVEEATQNPRFAAQRVQIVFAARQAAATVPPGTHPLAAADMVAIVARSQAEEASQIADAVVAALDNVAKAAQAAAEEAPLPQEEQTSAS